MTSSMNNISKDISMSGLKLEGVSSFKYLGTILSKNGPCSALQNCLSNGSDGHFKQDLGSNTTALQANSSYTSFFSLPSSSRAMTV